ncbi:MAG: glucosidase [Proteobacteria bacterium]|nr:glucosidase [Pseudomonadota bacterium]
MRTKEHERLAATRSGAEAWRLWGPYLSERQWGTVREDASSDGGAWTYFPHDHARSRAYRWGEDGLAGISDEKQRLCFALAMWNEKDPIIKERLFGLTNAEGNHGEDVKECYFYLDATPTHSYMKYLYKYPQAPFPYDELVRVNRQRSRHEPEYELLDTGVFDDERYFDVQVEYAKGATDDILIRLTVSNRGGRDAVLHLLPTLWFRNTWAMAPSTAPRPMLRRVTDPAGMTILEAEHDELGKYYLCAETSVPLLFTENETNIQRLYGLRNFAPWVKDGINNYLVKGDATTVNPNHTGTKAALHFALHIKARKSTTLQLRLTTATPGDKASLFGDTFRQIFRQRALEADEFYAHLAPDVLGDDEKNVFRQALAGLLWSKQYYHCDMFKWLAEREADPFSPSQRHVRNQDWFHMRNDDILSMPDKWEHPSYAAWDLAFHAAALAEVDIDYAKSQMEILFSDRYQHPSGQLPAHEWHFSDAHPPVHAAAALYLYRREKAQRAQGDTDFLQRMFSRLYANFTWWLNRKDRLGKTIYAGGFVSVDGIGIFDGTAALPTGGYLEQSTAAVWMAYYAQRMIDICLELAEVAPHYIDLAAQFISHFIWLASAMDRPEGTGIEMWDERDGFFYDVVRCPGGRIEKLRVRSMAGLLPLCATLVIEAKQWQRHPVLQQRVAETLQRLPQFRTINRDYGVPGVAGRTMLSIVDADKLRRILSRLLSEDEFLSPYGVRSLSKMHQGTPFRFQIDGQECRVEYAPGASPVLQFGGNANWRGPVWFPFNTLLVCALRQLHLYYGDTLKVACPSGSNQMMNLAQVAQEITRRLTNIFLKNADGHRPFHGVRAPFQNDVRFRDLVLFHEYFDGDTGQGMGASHQTGWTALIARLLHSVDTDPIF